MTKCMAKPLLTRNKEQDILEGWKGKSRDNSVKQLEKKTGVHEIRRVIFGEGAQLETRVAKKESKK